MKNYNKFILDKQKVDEGLFDFASKMFNKAKALINKTKGGKEIEVIYQKYLKLINDEFAKKAKVEIKLGASTGTPTDVNALKTEKKQNSALKTYSDFISINEADALPDAPADTPTVDDKKDPNNTESEAADPKKDGKQNIEDLKKKQVLMKKIIELYKVKALKEMDNILKKYGGSQKNPQLAIIIDDKKDQFTLDFMNAEIKFLRDNGDDNSANKLEKDSKELIQKMADNMDPKNLENPSIEIDGKKYKKNSPYRYKDDSGNIIIIEITNVDKDEKPLYKIKNDKDGPSKDDEEKQLKVENIIEDEPKKGEKYNYYSENANGVISVKIVGDGDKPGLIKVNAGNDDFDLNVGTLLDKTEDAEEQDKTPIKIDDKEYIPGDKYAYTNKEGKETEIEIVKASENDGNIIAKFTDEKYGGLDDQDFSVEKIGDKK